MSNLVARVLPVYINWCSSCRRQYDHDNQQPTAPSFLPLSGANDLQQLKRRRTASHTPSRHYSAARCYGAKMPSGQNQESSRKSARQMTPKKIAAFDRHARDHYRRRYPRNDDVTVVATTTMLMTSMWVGVASVGVRRRARVRCADC